MFYYSLLGAGCLFVWLFIGFCVGVVSFYFLGGCCCCVRMKVFIWVKMGCCVRG